MDDIYLPDEEQIDTVPFTRKEIKSEEVKREGTVGINASSYVKITFDRFVTLVANHSFMEVVEQNKNEEVIISTNLLTDLANARRISPRKMGPLLFAAGLVIGGFIAIILI